MRVELDLVGKKELLRRLEALPPKVERKVLRRALRAAQKVVRDEARRQMPRRTGTMRRALVVRAGRKRQRGVIVINTLFDTRRFPQLIKTYRGGLRCFYPAIVEYGSARRGIRPNPFLRRAWEARKGECLRTIRRMLTEGIEQEARRGAQSI